MSELDSYTGKGSSEFEEQYAAEAEDTGDHPIERFDAELLECTVEVLEPAPPICVGPKDNVAEAIRGMAERNQGCVLVVNDGVLVGIFTERDIMRKVVGKVDPKTALVEQVMTPDPEAVRFHDTIAVVLNKMAVGGFRHIPLVDIQLKPVGVVSMRDVIAYFIERFPHHVLNVPPNPLITNPDEVAGAG